jgi:hypothetical protein
MKSGEAGEAVENCGASATGERVLHCGKLLCWQRK